MNNKKNLVSGLMGGITNFLLGWLLDGFLFKDLYPKNENNNILFLFLGCVTFGLFISLFMYFFMYSNMPLDFENMSIGIAISILMDAFVGAVIAAVNGKLK